MYWSNSNTEGRPGSHSPSPQRGSGCHCPCCLPAWRGRDCCGSRPAAHRANSSLGELPLLARRALLLPRILLKPVSAYFIKIMHAHSETKGKPRAGAVLQVLWPRHLCRCEVGSPAQTEVLVRMAIASGPLLSRLCLGERRTDSRLIPNENPSTHPEMP